MTQKRSLKTLRETSKKMQNLALSEEEEIPPKEEDNLNESSGEDEEMYSWDKLEYKVNYICFISDKSTEKQV